MLITPNIPIRYTDISMTFTPNPVTGDINKLTNEDAIQSSVVNLVSTKNFEIPFHPEQGCSVMSSLFENITPMTSITIRRSIMDVLQNYEPRITLLGVQVQANPDSNGYDVIIIYQIVGTSTPITISMFLQKLR